MVDYRIRIPCPNCGASCHHPSWVAQSPFSLESFSSSLPEFVPGGHKIFSTIYFHPINIVWTNRSDDDGVMKKCFFNDTGSLSPLWRRNKDDNFWMIKNMFSIMSKRERYYDIVIINYLLGIILIFVMQCICAGYPIQGIPQWLCGRSWDVVVMVTSTLSFIYFCAFLALIELLPFQSTKKSFVFLCVFCSVSFCSWRSHVSLLLLLFTNFYHWNVLDNTFDTRSFGSVDQSEHARMFRIFKMLLVWLRKELFCVQFALTTLYLFNDVVLWGVYSFLFDCDNVVAKENLVVKFSRVLFFKVRFIWSCTLCLPGSVCSLCLFFSKTSCVIWWYCLSI